MRWSKFEGKVLVYASVIDDRQPVLVLLQCRPSHVSVKPKKQH